MTLIEKIIDAARIIDHANRLRDHEALHLAARRLSELMSPFAQIEGDSAFRNAVIRASKENDK